MRPVSAETELAKDSTDKSERAGPQKARRKPLTIDLPAEEVERKTSAATAADAAAEPQNAASADAAASAASAASSAAVAAEPAAQTTATEEKAQQPEAPDSDKPPASEERKAPGPEPYAASKGTSKQGDPSIAFVPLLVAAVMGGVLVALVVVLLARGGFFLPPPDSEDPLAPLRDTIATLKQSVAELQDREPVPASDTAALTDLEGRVAALSRDIEALKSTAPADSSAVASEVASLRQEVDSLSAKLESAPGEERIAALEAKLDAANTKIDAANAKVDAASAKIDAAAALAPAVAADALAAALDSGHPFANELAALRTLGVGAATLDALAPRADSGLPTLASLRATFEREIATVDLAEPIPEGTSVMDRLVRSARGLVDVRPAHPTEGADPTAVVARIRAALEADDLKTALSERESLPDAAKAATADFARDAEARQSADDLVAKLRAEALAQLEAGH
jgi:hypothetical protein